MWLILPPVLVVCGIVCGSNIRTCHHGSLTIYEHIKSTTNHWNFRHVTLMLLCSDDYFIVKVKPVFNNQPVSTLFRRCQQNKTHWQI